jgi:MFS family permease
MYLAERDQAYTPPSYARVRFVDRNVILLGLTSLFTDVSSEMVSAVVPLYLTFVLGFSALQFGIVGGAYQGITALLRVFSGTVADRWQRHKEMAAAGYGLSAVCKLGLFAAGTTWSLAVGCLFLDRIGKGIRTAPRDALISLSSSPARLAEAFGVHRTLDTVGAILGPLVGFALLALVPGRFDAVFLTSFCMATIGLGVLALFVQNRGARARMPSPASRSAARLFARPAFTRLAASAGALALVTISDGFVFLSLQRRADFDARFFPLLYVGTALGYLLLALPVGRVADRVGRRRVFLAGHVALTGAYALLLLPSPGAVVLIGCTLLVGAYYAATDGVLMALATAMLPRSRLATGLAILTTVMSIARFLAAVLFGALWSWHGPEYAAGIFGAGLLFATLLAALLLPGQGHSVRA